MLKGSYSICRFLKRTSRRELQTLRCQTINSPSIPSPRRLLIGDRMNLSEHDFFDEQETVDFRSMTTEKSRVAILTSQQESRILALLTHDVLSTGSRVASVTSVINRLERDATEYCWEDILLVHLPINNSSAAALARQLICSDIPTDVLVQVQDLSIRLTAANALTLSFCRFPADQRHKGGVHIEVLIGAWRDLSEAAFSLIGLLKSSKYMDQQYVSTSSLVDTQNMLSSCANGGSPCVMDDFSLEIPGIAERRHHPRWLVDWPITILLGPSEKQATLVNISAGGCCVCTTETLRIGERLSLLTESGRGLSGKVVWTKARYYGLQFSHPLETTDPLLGSAKCR